MKIVLGAAQIGMNYGLFNNKKISKSQFKKIEKKIFSSGYIKYIDTANTYGKSEKNCTTIVVIYFFIIKDISQI